MYKLVIISLIIAMVSGCGTFTKEIKVKMIKPLKAPNVTKIAVVTPKDGLPIDGVIAEQLIQKLEAKGKLIVKTEEAEYIIALTIPHKLNRKGIDGGKVARAAFAGGLSSGAITYGATRSGSSSAGAALGGAIVGGLIGYAVQDATVALQLDVVLTDPTSKDKYQETRIFSTVKQVHLSEEEGKVVLIEKLAQEVANLFKGKK